MTHRRGRKHRERSIDCRNPTGLSQFVLTGEEMRTYIDFQSISVIQTICQQYPSSKLHGNWASYLASSAPLRAFNKRPTSMMLKVSRTAIAAPMPKKTKAQSPGLAQSSADTLANHSGAGLLCLVGMILVFFLEGANTQYMFKYFVRFNPSSLG